MRLRGRSSCSVGGGGLMGCAVSIGCVAALRPPHDLGPSRPKVPTLPGSEGSLFLPRAGWSAGADGNTDLRLPPSSLSSSSGQGSSRLLRLAEFTPRSVSSISFPSDRLPSRASPTAAVTLQGGRTAKRHLPDTYQYERRERQRGIVIDNDAVVDC